MDEIDALRAFNRFYVRQLGFLGQSYVDSGLGLTEARIMYELAHGAPVGARGLADRLGLDEGYLSRVLGRFERRGWLRREPDERDGRARTLSLMPTGWAVMTPLEDRTRDQIGAQLAALAADARAEVLDAAMRLRRAMGDPALDPGAVSFRDLRPGDAGWLVSRHGELYARDEGYDVTFEALVAEILAAYLRHHDPDRERAWIAVADGRRVGSIFCVRKDDETAQLRLFLVEPEMRGRGVGRRMLALCLDHARDKGYRRMMLWTHASHRAACALYAAQGFAMVKETPNRAFGQDVVEQVWTRDLRAP